MSADTPALIARLDRECKSAPACWRCYPNAPAAWCLTCSAAAALAQLAQERDDWSYVADGLKHHFECENNAATAPNPGFVCQRCHLDAAEQQLAEARAQLASAEQDRELIDRAVAWVTGEEGIFEPVEVFRGVVPKYWWRSRFRGMLPERFHHKAAAARPPQEPGRA